MSDKVPYNLFVDAQDLALAKALAKEEGWFLNQWFDWQFKNPPNITSRNLTLTSPRSKRQQVSLTLTKNTDETIRRIAEQATCSNSDVIRTVLRLRTEAKGE